MIEGSSPAGTGDEGKELACRLRFPDPTNISVLETAIDVLELLRDVLFGVVDLIELIEVSNQEPLEVF